MPIVKFVNEKKEIEVPSGANLRKEALKAGINLYAEGNGTLASLKMYVLNCHGLGQCGTCRVLITKGIENTNPRGLIEKVRFHLPVPDPCSMSYIGHEDTMRLACRTRVYGDIEVQTRPPFDLFGQNFYS
jgi:ferredoxin